MQEHPFSQPVCSCSTLKCGTTMRKSMPKKPCNNAQTRRLQKHTATENAHMTRHCKTCAGCSHSRLAAACMPLQCATANLTGLDVCSNEASLVTCSHARAAGQKPHTDRSNPNATPGPTRSALLQPPAGRCSEQTQTARSPASGPCRHTPCTQTLQSQSSHTRCDSPTGASVDTDPTRPPRPLLLRTDVTHSGTH